MARVTVEDCVDKIENRFELVLLASHRTRTISAGAQLTVPRDNDKNPVVALREIAEGLVSQQTVEEPEVDETEDLMAALSEELAELANAQREDMNLEE